jgi:GntR family transcriptional regulator
MTLRRENGLPLYLQVAQMLEHDIANGTFPPYARLMSESGLMRRFGVSRVTVRAAIMRLVQKGLVDVRQGKGTFVAGPVIRQGLDRFHGIHDVLVAQGLAPERRLLEYRAATPDECAGTPFASAGERPTLLRRLYVLHGKPFAAIRALLAPAVAVSRGEAQAQTILEMLARPGRGAARADIAIRARPAPADVRTLLAVPRRRAVLVMQRTSFDADDAPLDFTVYHIVPEAWEFTVNLTVPVPQSPAPAPRDGSLPLAA